MTRKKTVSAYYNTTQKKTIGIHLAFTERTVKVLNLSTTTLDSCFQIHFCIILTQKLLGTHKNTKKTKGSHCRVVQENEAPSAMTQKNKTRKQQVFTITWQKEALRSRCSLWPNAEVLYLSPQQLPITFCYHPLGQLQLSCPCAMYVQPLRGPSYVC